MEHRRDRTDVQRILSSWVADDRDKRKPWIDQTAYDVHDIRCYRLSTWTERGIFPVEWYNRDRPSQPPCAQLYAFLESFWRSVLARPVDQHCYRYYDELENGPELVREFVSRLSLARVQAFLGMAGISWRRPPKAPDCHHEWCDHRWRSDLTEWKLPFEERLRQRAAAVLYARMRAEIGGPFLELSVPGTPSGRHHWPYPRPLPWERDR